MKILAIDVGIKNLSYCLLSASGRAASEMSILEWDNLCVTEAKCNKLKTEEMTEAILQALMIHFDDSFEVDVVVIENQPMLKNGMMKTVSVVIYTYFNILKILHGGVKEVRFISATNKLKCRVALEAGGATGSYKERKNLSVEVVRAYLPHVAPDKSAWFESLKKADDAADCALFAIYVAETSRFN